MSREEARDTLAGLVKRGLEHSIAQVFLIFSGVLVLISVFKENDYVVISFFTLFYAFVNFKVEGIRKHESLGDHAVGNNFGAVLYSLISLLLLVGWILGSVVLLSDVGSTLGYLKNNFSLLSWITGFVLIGALALFVSWMLYIFLSKWERDGTNCEQPDETKCYEVECCCKNCDLDRKVGIPKKIQVEHHPCPECEIGGVLRKKKECKKSQIDGEN